MPVPSWASCTKSHPREQRVLGRDRHSAALLRVQRICAAHRALRGSRGFYPVGYYHELAGRGKIAQLITQHIKSNTSSSLKLNNAQNWVLENTSLSFVPQGEQCSLIYIQICDSVCSHIYLIICYCQILGRKKYWF